jgi:hypothetical protein
VAGVRIARAGGIEEICAVVDVSRNVPLISLVSLDLRL